MKTISQKLCFICVFLSISMQILAEEKDKHESTPTFLKNGVYAQAFTDIAVHQGIDHMIPRISFGWALWEGYGFEVAGGLDSSIAVKGKDLTAFGPTVDLRYRLWPDYHLGLWVSHANGYYPRENLAENQNKYIDVSARTVGLRAIYLPYPNMGVYLGVGNRTSIRVINPADNDTELKEKISGATSSLLIGMRFSS